jgi:hypothetical protein
MIFLPQKYYKNIVPFPFLAAQKFGTMAPDYSGRPEVASGMSMVLGESHVLLSLRQ